MAIKYLPPRAALFIIISKPDAAAASVWGEEIKERNIFFYVRRIDYSQDKTLDSFSVMFVYHSLNNKIFSSFL